MNKKPKRLPGAGLLEIDLDSTDKEFDAYWKAHDGGLLRQALSKREPVQQPGYVHQPVLTNEQGFKLTSGQFNSLINWCCTEAPKSTRRKLIKAGWFAVGQI